jgi:hypothetical protein
LADGFDGIVDAVDDADRRPRIPRQIGPVTVGGIGMAAGGADRLTGRVDTRTRNEPGIDSIAQGHRFVALIRQITNSREAGQQRPPRVDGRADGIFGIVPVKLIDIARAFKLHRKVGMTVDQAGHTGSARTDRSTACCWLRQV